ncbi:hypothetical protein CC86DRAFT_373064 [Ophiobolus disseminans]|uniref:Uncharacterized protein n=1 Tax=Ophiobolus disseminans TaxID=1469910 RepID=A0A6A6ZPA4_9PLEO|nr:hypothetical protein CC86DRAFT_373064 [Ophiobolus disseminans]
MKEPQPDAYALLESHFNHQSTLQPYKHFPRRSDEDRNFSAAAAPLVLQPDDDTESVFSSQQPTPLEPPGPLNGADSGLPPTPPTMSQDGRSTQTLESSPHADSVVNSLMSKKSSLSTPVNARSPPTPDPSPPRTASSNTAPERPQIFAYPSSRAESFMTAREDPLSSEPSEGRSITPLGDRLSTVEEDRGLGLAFEHGDNDVTPTEHVRPLFPYAQDADTTAGADEDKDTPADEDVPHREWNTNVMRNVTVRRKRRPNSSSPSKQPPDLAVDIVETASPSPSPRRRRTSGLRERVEASTNSPATPSIEHFAQSIGWPSEAKVVPEEKERVREDKGRDEKDKRNSASSMGSTIVEASIIVTPPRRRQTLRHSGKNMAYRDEGSPTPDRASRRHSNRQSSQSDEPLHRLVHKRVGLADRSKRVSVESDTLGTERSISSPLSFRSRIIDSSAATLAHQESVRNVLQPAADILSRSSSVTRPYYTNSSYHKRMSSAPEPARKSALSAGPRAFSQLSPPTSPRRAANVSFETPVERTSPIQSPVPSVASPRSLKRRQRSDAAEARQAADVNKSLPDVPIHDDGIDAEQDVFLGASGPAEEVRPPSALMERVRQLVAAREAEEAVPDKAEPSSASPEFLQVPIAPQQPRVLSPLQENSPPLARDPRTSPARTEERRRSSLSQDRASTSPKYPIRPSLDRQSTEEFGRRSHEWRRPSEEHGRVSFDRSTMRTEEYGNARHLYASTTPFSQFSDTPIEISEATSVSIIPHNNTSLLVVQQQPSRVNSMAPEPRQLTDEAFLSPHDYRDARSTPTPPFVDASEEYLDDAEQSQPQQPTLNFEPSTPPMQITLPQPGAVDSPLKNPRAPPEPPKINFIPPTPAEELERQLVPGPPKRSDSHPQRRLSLVQRARRYSDNLIPTLLNRGGSTRNRNARRSHHRNNDPHEVPTVADGDGTLHPFWRPRGFWDDFTDSESESDEDEGLHPGGDTSDVETLPEAPKRSNTLGKKLTNWRNSSGGGFLIGNSLGVERHGTNKRRHHVTLPPHFPRSPRVSETVSSPKILVQPPTQPLGPHAGSAIRKSSSYGSLRQEHNRSWRNGRSLPGLKKYQVQYIGLSGVKERLRERGKEKRRERIRQSIGSRYYVEPGGVDKVA